MPDSSPSAGDVPLAYPLVPATADGSLKIVVSRTYPLEQAAEALRFVRDGHAGGKVVLLPS